MLGGRYAVLVSATGLLRLLEGLALALVESVISFTTDVTAAAAAVPWLQSRTRSPDGLVIEMHAPASLAAYDSHNWCYHWTGNLGRLNLCKVREGLQTYIKALRRSPQSSWALSNHVYSGSHSSLAVIQFQNPILRRGCVRISLWHRWTLPLVMVSNWLSCLHLPALTTSPEGHQQRFAMWHLHNYPVIANHTACLDHVVFAH